MLVRKQNNISTYKAKSTMQFKENISYAAVYSNVSGISEKSKKTLLSGLNNAHASGEFGNNEKDQFQ